MVVKVVLLYLHVLARVTTKVNKYHKQKLAPYGTDGRLLPTANIKVT